MALTQQLVLLAAELEIEASRNAAEAGRSGERGNHDQERRLAGRSEGLRTAVRRLDEMLDGYMVR
jgi:hypothetical protein